MVEVLARRVRRADAGRQAAAAVEYARLGWPVCPGAVGPHTGPARHRMPALATRGQRRSSGRACSCDRIGCPAPGAHPISAAWQIEASNDPAADCEPDSFTPVAGLRWHCRDSYVVAPARTARGPGAHWMRDPTEHRLPDGLRLLEFLADACEEVLR